MDSNLGLGGIGGFGAIFIIFWVIASVLLPFLVWGIYNQTHASRRELEKIRKAIELQVVTQRQQAGLPPLKTKGPIDNDPARNM